LAEVVPIAPNKQIILGFKCGENAATIRIGKYGIGTKMMILPMKLIRNMPRYPRQLKIARIPLMSIDNYCQEYFK
jgi:hypothetical protein